MWKMLDYPPFPGENTEASLLKIKQLTRGMELDPRLSGIKAQVLASSPSCHRLWLWVTKAVGGTWLGRMPRGQLSRPPETIIWSHLPHPTPPHPSPDILKEVSKKRKEKKKFHRELSRMRTDTPEQCCIGVSPIGNPPTERTTQIRTSLGRRAQLLPGLTVLSPVDPPASDGGPLNQTSLGQRRGGVRTKHMGPSSFSRGAKRPAL